MILSPVEVRVLGSLIEKSITTPDYYPLSLNALTNACNQSSNRSPVVDYDEPTVAGAIDTLRRQSLVRGMQRADSRVTKYSHLADEAQSLDSRELAALCVLMLRGAQTAGEIRTRTARLFDFESVAAVESTLDALAARPDPLVARLPRRPGQKEVRFAHLLSGEPAPDESFPESASELPSPSSPDRLAALEETVTEMQRELADLRTQLDGFRKQFE